ncbi:MAG: hypothetical protein ACRDEA_21145, partial [Microcystaceae cyanobacterium]
SKVEDLFRQAAHDQIPLIERMTAFYILNSHSHPGELVGVVIFDSPTSYQKSVNDALQDVWYSQLRALLESDPDWNDGDFVAINRRIRGL